MLIIKNDKHVGVKCDLCNKPMTENFTYYSFDGELIKVSQQNKMVLKAGGEYSFDACDTCYDNMIINIQAALANAKACALVDDLTGQPMSGEFEYIRYLVSKCEVNIRNEEDPQNVTKNILDINVSKNSNNKLRGK